ncbi:MAG: glycosyltransferase family 2 protein [Deltaproteobacteria bacterium]|nr:glycosyltransferase family 2 protein [Deltaproteobacteria bacterium]
MNNKTRPSLSVILCNYNHSHYLEECLSAILHQSYQAFEIIIIDDGSTDNSLQILSNLAAQNPVIQLIRHSENKGVIFSANEGFHLATGDYVYSAGADDKILPGFFEKSMEMLAQYPKAGLCCSDPVTFDGDTNIFADNRQGVSEACYLSPEEIVVRMKRRFFWIAGHTSLMRRTVFLEAGTLIPELRWHCDWFALHVIAFRYGICYVPGKLATLRVHSTTYSKKPRPWLERQQVYRLLFETIISEKYRDTLPFFKRSGILSTFFYFAFITTFSSPRFYRFLNWPFLEAIIRSVIKAVLKRIPGAQRLYHFLKQREAS